MEPNRLEEQFRDKLEQRTIQPSKMAWDRLDAMLSVNEEKEEQKVIGIKKPNRSWMYMAASFIVFATIGTFFLTRESGNGNNPSGTGTSVVNTENTVKPGRTNDTMPSSVQPAIENLSLPAMKQEAVAEAQTPKTSSSVRTVKNQGTASPGMKTDTGIVPPSNSQGVATVTYEGFKDDVLKDVESDKLLAVSMPQSPKKKSKVKVDANSLLSSVEGELDESFRDKALYGVIKNFNAVKSSVANRNYHK